MPGRRSDAHRRKVVQVSRRAGSARVVSLTARCVTSVAFGAALVFAVLPMAVPTPAYAAGVPSGGDFGWLAGYSVDADGVTAPPSTVSADFHVPVPTCTEKSLVGFGVLDNNVTSTVRETCVRGPHRQWVPLYTAQIDVGIVDNVLGTTVRPNDLITVSISVTLSTTSATFTDDTTGFTQTLAEPGGTADFAVLGSVSDAINTNKKVPMFPTVSFSNALVNGAGIGTYNGLQEVLQATVHGRQATVQIEPGSLGTSSFQVNWVS